MGVILVCLVLRPLSAWTCYIKRIMYVYEFNDNL